MPSTLRSRIVILSVLFCSVAAQETRNNTLVATKACACYNQGVCDVYTGACICPSGFLGHQCEQAQPTTLCNNVVCQNSGVCNILSATEASCWCLLGFHGEFCERQQAASRCSQIQCQNGAICYEHSPATSIFAYCACPPGFTGRFCETEYFRCSRAGTFADGYKCAQGFYFLCDHSNRLIAGRCPRGLRFNLQSMSCDRASAVTCPNRV